MSKLLRAAKPLDDESGLHALVLDVLVIRKYGPESIAWDSPVLLHALTEDFGAPGPKTWERIQALRCMHMTNAFWLEWEVFEKCTAAICGRIPSFDFSQPAEAEELAAAIHTAGRVDKHAYSADVKHYVGASCLSDGLWYTEGELKELADAPIRTFLDTKGIEVDFSGVAAHLDKPSETSPEDPVGVQVSRVLSVRETLARYDTELAAQFVKIPTFLGVSS